VFSPISELAKIPFGVFPLELHTTHHDHTSCTTKRSHNLSFDIPSRNFPTMPSPVKVTKMKKSKKSSKTNHRMNAEVNDRRSKKPSMFSSLAEDEIIAFKQWQLQQANASKSSSKSPSSKLLESQANSQDTYLEPTLEYDSQIMEVQGMILF
jgi:hypothetical protein